jgi:hypothetical protein
LLRQDETLQQYGISTAVIDDFSPYQLGTEGWYEGVHFELIGRIRRVWSAGVWNEWYVRFDDGRTGWLAEAQGQLSLLFEVDDSAERERVGKEVWRRRSVGIMMGTEYRIKQKRLFIVDRKEARPLAYEGELPALAQPARFLDLVSADGDAATIELLAETEVALLYLGRFVRFSEMKFSNLRELEGWQPK